MASKNTNRSGADMLDDIRRRVGVRLLASVQLRHDT